MVTNETDSALGSALMTLRGFQWVYGARQDPYALLLRAESDDPHELGRRVRDSGTLTWSSAETWVTAHHAVAVRLLADERLALRQPERDEAAPAWTMPTLDDMLPMDAAMLKLGRAECTRLRECTEAALLEPRLELLHKEIALAADRQAAELPEKFDVMTDYAYPVATRAVALLLGVPAHQYERFARLCAGAASALDATLCPPKVETAKLLLDSLAGVRELCDELVAARRAEPAEDLLGAVVGASGEADDPVSVAVLFAVVGVELAATAIANTVTTLLTETQWSTVVSSPESVADLVREALRLAPPVRLQRLVAQTDLDLEATAVKAGNQIVVLTEAANRDPAVFPVPDRFDASRPADPAPLWAHDTLPTGVVAEFVRGFAATAVTALARHASALRATEPGYRRLRSPVTGTPLCRPVVTGPAGEE